MRIKLILYLPGKNTVLPVCKTAKKPHTHTNSSSYLRRNSQSSAHSLPASNDRIHPVGHRMLPVNVHFFPHRYPGSGIIQSHLAINQRNVCLHTSNKWWRFFCLKSINSHIKIYPWGWRHWSFFYACYQHLPAHRRRRTRYLRTNLSPIRRTRPTLWM